MLCAGPPSAYLAAVPDPDRIRTRLRPDLAVGLGMCYLPKAYWEIFSGSIKLNDVP